MVMSKVFLVILLIHLAESERRDATSQTECRDGDRRCPGWRHLCNTHANVQRRCRKTCNDECQGSDENDNQVEDSTNPVNASEWKTHPQTGKEYKVLTFSNKKDYNASKQICSAYGGYLPEPKDCHENHFVKNLTTTQIFLGITYYHLDKVYKWNSDNKTVGWFHWEKWNKGYGYNTPEPNERPYALCVVIINVFLANNYNHYNLDTWSDETCTVGEKNVVCEKRRS